MNVRWTWIRILGLLCDLERVTNLVQTFEESAVVRTQVPEFESQLYRQLCASAFWASPFLTYKMTSQGSWKLLMESA